MNFAVYFPLLDRLFATHHLPENKWPSGYGLEGHLVLLGYEREFKFPSNRKSAVKALPR